MIFFELLIFSNFSKNGNVIFNFISMTNMAQPTRLDLNKKYFPKQKTIQNFTIDVQGFRNTKNENPPTKEIGDTT